MSYTAKLRPKGPYLFQYIKGLDFTSGGMRKGREICHFGL